MKIAEVVATFPPYHGGMGYVCYHNALELAKRGHAVKVFTLDHARLSCDDDPPEIKIERLKPLIALGDAGLLPHLVRRLRGFDVIHLHYPFYGGAEFVLLAASIYKIPYVLTYHMDVVGNTLAKRAVLGLYNPLLRARILQKASRIGALTLEHLASSDVKGLVDWNEVVEVANGVDIELFRPREKKPELVAKHNLQGKTVALFVGNIQPFKGLHLLIDAIAAIDRDDLVLLVVGDGYAADENRRRVAERGLGHRVIFAGAQSPRGALPDYYNLGDFLVLPSTHSESFGLVVLEAFASGIPAIVSALPGPSKVVDNGVDGLIVRIGDVKDLREKILFLAQHADIRHEMGVSARLKVESRYSWSRAAEQLEQVFHAVCAKRKSSCV